MKTWRLGVLVGGLLFGEAFSQLHAAPVNDDFENRIVLTGSSVTFTGTLQSATIQPAEPQAVSFDFSVWPHGYNAQRQGASVWWSWTANTSTPVTLEAMNLSTNELKLGGIDVWTGTNGLSNLTFVAGSVLDSGRHPYLTFAATNGITYQLRVVGTNYGDFTLKLTETNLPIIFVQPLTRTALTNGSVFFGVMTAGNPPFASPFSYQWRFNDVDLPGETFPILGLDNLTTNQSGSYSVIVSNTVGGTVSDTITLNVTEATAPAQLQAAGSFDGQFSFGINGELGGLFRVQSSTNLLNWSEEKSFPREFIYYNTEGNLCKKGCF